MKATLYRANGVRLDLEGTPDEIATAVERLSPQVGSGSLAPVWPVGVPIPLPIVIPTPPITPQPLPWLQPSWYPVVPQPATWTCDGSEVSAARYDHRITNKLIQ